MIQKVAVNYFSPYTPVVKNNVSKNVKKCAEKTLVPMAEKIVTTIENKPKAKGIYWPEIFY